MRALRCSALVFLSGVALAAPLAAQETEESSDDLVRSQLSMSVVQSVTVGFSPALGADGAAHRELLTGSRPSARVRVGELEVSPRFRSGGLAVDLPDPPDPRPQTFELWLARFGSSWALEARKASDDETASSNVVWGIPLTRANAATTSPTLSAAIVPTDDEAGLLVLSWGDHRWTGEFDFAEAPAGAAAAAAAAAAAVGGGQAQPGGATTENRQEFDADTSVGSRAITLGERNETAIVLPDEASSRVAVLYWKDQSVEHPDFAAIASVADGAVVRLTEAAVLRLRTMLPLQFGGVEIDTENLAPGFPGSYGLWLKRAGSGWRLVFNNEPDSWGTQHDPDFDAGEIDVEYSQDEGSTRPLGVALVPTGARSGRLVIHWGAHEWSSDFTISG